MAAFGQLLRGGEYLEDWTYAHIEGLARGSRGEDRYGYRSEFLQLIALADSLASADRLGQNSSYPQREP